MFGFIGDKMLRDARRRDFLRSKLSAGKRLEAKIRADRIVDKHIELQNRDNAQSETRAFREKWDDAMETTVKDLKETGSIKRIAL